MNTLKPLLICAVLAGIGYGVYVRINSGNDLPPPGAPQDWNAAAPEIQLGDLGAPTAPPSAMGAAGGAAAPWPAGPAAPGSEAPPFASAPAPPVPQTADAGASPFAPPVVHGTSPPAGAAAPPFDHGAGATAAAESFPPNNDPAELAAPPAGAAPSPVDGYPAPDAPDRYQTSEASVPNSVDRYQTPPSADPGVAAPADQYGTPQNAAPDAYPTQEFGAPPGSEQQPQSPQGSLAEVIESARQDLEAGQMAAALEKLSLWYNDPRLAPAEQQQLNQLLDQVAGTVVYSTQHLLEPPYEVQAGERLEDIAQRYSVSWQLLAKINGIDDPAALRPGERIKVVRGPFNAVVDLERRELTLVLANGSYAGRFPIGLGQDQPPREGNFTVSDKVVDPVYHGQSKVIGAGDQSNPYGNRWIGLGTDLAIHGTDRPENVGRTDLPGSISLKPQDIQDVFDILAAGSQVTIRR